MRALIIAFASLLMAAPVMSQTTINSPAKADERFKIALSIYGTRIDGAQEKAPRFIGKAASQQLAVLNETLPTLTYGQSMQLKVEVTDPYGVTKDHTKTGRIMYESFGCLTISAAGLLTVVPTSTGDCSLTELYVIYKDATGVPINANTFMFKVVH